LIHHRSAKSTLQAFFAAAPLLVAAAWAFAQEQPVAPPLAPIETIDDATRARVLAALAGLIILGFAMVLLTWLAARIVHRYRHGTSYFRPTRRPSEHDWAKRPLVPPDPPSSDAPFDS